MNTKKLLALIFLLIFLFSAVITASAQQAESVWIDTDTIGYKTEEIVIVRVNAISSVPIQGFTFQIRYDPACLEPLNASTPITGMNGLQLPQSSGLLDATFASTTPHQVGGVIAEASFITLGGCNTMLRLESAILAIRGETGVAVALPNITLGQRDIALVIDKAVGNTQEYTPLGTPLPLGMAEAASANSEDDNLSFIVPLIILGILGLSVVAGVGLYMYLNKKPTV